MKADILASMPQLTVTLHELGLHPTEAARAWHLHTNEDMSLEDVRDEVVNLRGERPGKKAVWSAVQRVATMKPDDLLPQTKYANCGRKPALTDAQEQAIVDIARKWRHKRFCTCGYIKRLLRLKVSKRTIARALNKHGFFWRPVPKKRHLSKADLQKREEFWKKYGAKTHAWWVQNLNLVLDGVTLTMPPKPLNARERHAAQAIKHMWVREGEKMDNDLHTFNRYGPQLGTKVPLWGGFTGGGRFTLRLWTPKAKMTKAEWVERIPALKRAIDIAGERRSNVKAKVWHDSEKFLLQPSEYRRHNLELVRFPPNSGDLNPIETVWAELRKHLALREQEDLEAGRVLTLQQFRKRASQILASFGEDSKGEGGSFLSKLVRGMPRRLLQCKANNFGRCGK